MPEPNPSPAPKNDPAATATSDAIARPASPRRAVDKIPRQFGRYRIEETLGKGGMGAVFRAYDTQLDRQVALKVPFLGDDEAETRQRFFREARAAATLQHAYICPVFDVGEFNDIPYLTMAFVEGRSLNQALSAGQTFTFAQVAVLVRKLCLGMQEAHNRGVVHRDLKPANVLLRPNGEPVIMDFGLARRADDKRSHGLTQEGDILGTLDYMSPEQAEGNHASVGPATDVYALGAILYELLCGQRPFKGNTASMLVQILTKEPPRPGEVRPGVPARLEEICLKAMAKKPEDRFPTMTAFAISLAEYLRGLQSGSGSGTAPRPAAPAVPAAETPRPAATQVTRRGEVEEPPTTPRSSSRRLPRSSRKGPRSGKRARQKQSSQTMMVLGAAVAVLALVVVVVVIAAVRSSNKKDDNDHIAAVAQGGGSSIPPRPPQQGGGPPQQPRPAQGPSTQGPSAGPNRPNLPPAAGTRPGPGNVPGQGAAPAVTVAPKPPSGLTLRPEPDSVSLAVGDTQQVALKLDRGDYRGPVTLKWSAPRELHVSPGGPVKLEPGQTEVLLTVRLMAQAPATEAKLEVVASYDQESQRADVKSALAVRVMPGGLCTRVVEMPLPAGFGVEALAFSPDAAVALIGGGGAGRPAAGPGPPPGAGPPGGPPPGGGPAGGRPPAGDAPAGDANAIRILNLERGEVIATLAGHKDRVAGVVVSADAKTALSHGADDALINWDLVQGRARKLEKLPRILRVSMSPDAKRGLVLLADGFMKFNPESLTRVGRVYAINALPVSQVPEALRAAAISADNRVLVGGLDGKLCVIDPPEKGKAAAPKPLKGHDETVLCAAFDPAGKVAATAGGGILRAGKLQPGRDNAVRLWDAAGHTLLWTAPGHPDSVVCLAFSADGSLLASGSADGTVFVWSVRTGHEVARLTGHAGRVLGVGFAPDNRTVWSGAADKTLRQWRLP